MFRCRKYAKSVTAFYVMLTLMVWQIWRHHPVTIPHTSDNELFNVELQTGEFLKFKGNIRKERVAVEDNVVAKLHKCSPFRSRNLDCQLLVRGDIDYTKEVKARKQDREFDRDCSLENLLENCTDFKNAHGYLSKPVTDEEREYPLAFTIKMHKNINQMEQMFRSLYRSHNIYCIYVDQKSSPSIFSIAKTLSMCLDNVIVVDDRISVVYASIYHIRAELQCMRALSESTVKWKYYINLTGQEFVIKTNLEIVSILKSLNGANDVEGYKYPKHIEWRFKYAHRIVNGKLAKTNITRAPFKYTVPLYKGSAYAMLRREFIDFVINDDIIKMFMEWLSDTYSPEEIFWSTINTLPWAPGGYTNETFHKDYTHASKAVIWSWDKFKCQGKSVRSVCIYGVADLPWLNSRPEITANKFDHDFDNIPLHCLEELLHNRTLNPNLNGLDWSYYRLLPHAKFYSTVPERSKDMQHLQELKEKWITSQSPEPKKPLSVTPKISAK